MIGLLILNIWPIIETFLLSFQKSLGFNRYEFAGFENFAKLFSDADVWIGLKNTFIFALVSVPLGIFFSLLVAWLLCKPIRGVSTYRMLFFLPMVAAPAAVTMVYLRRCLRGRI